tara:strand:- start:45 stop:356 length:312 start_codon:yes stop_codon:yes gene_type:complete
MVAVVGAGISAKKLADKIEKVKKDKESRNPDPKKPKTVELDEDKKIKKTTKSLQELEPAKPGIDKPTGKIQSFAKGGRAMYGSGSKVCKLAKRGKGKAYGKNS